MAEFTFEYFRDEFRRFWEVCGERSRTSDELLRGFSGLCYVAANTIGDDKRINTLLATAKINLDYRLPYFLTKELNHDHQQRH